MGKTVQVMDKKIHHDKTLIEKLSHEIAQLKRFKFAKRSEQMGPGQASLLDDLISTDIAAIEAELESLQVTPATTQEKQKPKRRALPPEFPPHAHPSRAEQHGVCLWLRAQTHR